MSATSHPSSSQVPQADPLYRFKLRSLQAVLSIGTVVLLAVWAFEGLTGQLIPIDAMSYPIMASLLVSFLLLLQLRPRWMSALGVLSFGTLAAYLLIYLYSLLFGDIASLDLYALASFVQWFPLVYTAAFMFLSTRHAGLVSAAIYLATLLPNLAQGLWHWPVIDSDFLRALLTNMNLSHPVYIALLLGISQLKEHLVQANAHADLMSVAASVDNLTGASNRRHADARLRELLAQQARGGREFTVIMLDMDHFKRVNDTFGHASGDHVLIATVNLLAQALRPHDIVSRWGGEELLLIVPETRLPAARALAERLRALIEAADFAKVGRVTASLGVSVSASGDTPETLLARADEALYRAKQLGRNRVELGDGQPTRAIAS